MSQLTASRREFVFRFRSPAEFADFFRQNYGPVRKAFEALDDSGQEQLHADLTALAATHDRAPGPSVAMASEYLEAIAVRR